MNMKLYLKGPEKEVRPPHPVSTIKNAFSVRDPSM